MNGKANRLVHEKSPYLLQHAYNPVNWYPWCTEAFEKARTENKPIFLSIGYSACHWCHVMEKECFSDKEVAKALNQDFISIKVDKEERPDLDIVYMSVCQAFTGQGGWPTTIFMTSEQKPFFAGTYFPKQSLSNQPGFLELISMIKDAWKNKPQQLFQTAEEVAELLSKPKKKKEKALKTEELIAVGVQELAESFDEIYGGFGTKPKFPMAHNLLFLMEIHQKKRDKETLHMVEKTLLQMHLGGMYDHIGFGFSRYSTDEKWLVPHFEKMLYDNALLALAYIEFYRITKKKWSKEVAECTLEYVKKELSNAEGGFYAAQDADVDGAEGKYYVFTEEEIYHVLGNAKAVAFNDCYHINSFGNFEGKNIPNLLDEKDFFEKRAAMEESRKQIESYRKQRERIHTDDKILTAWNALMIVAFARAYKVFDLKEYKETAEKAVAFLQKYLMKENQDLYVRYRDGESVGQGYLDDYAFYCWALLELAESTDKRTYLQKALEIQNRMVDLFWDTKEGGFYFTAKNQEALLFRPKEVYDGAVPSGNAVAAYVMLRLRETTGDHSFDEVIKKQMQFLGMQSAIHPSSFTFGLLAQLEAMKAF